MKSVVDRIREMSRDFWVTHGRAPAVLKIGDTALQRLRKECELSMKTSEPAGLRLERNDFEGLSIEGSPDVHEISVGDPF